MSKTKSLRERWTEKLIGVAFYEAAQRSFVQNLMRTILQSLVLWLGTLVLLPWGLRKLEGCLGMVPFTTPAQSWLPWVVFALSAWGNLSAGWTMARWGEGTPLPLDTARHLVVRGIYRVIRNPMAFFGLGLGASVGWWLGSWLMLAAVVAGGFFWNFLVRPAEEVDLLRRFGEAYAHYRDHVPCWRFCWPPYRVGGKDAP